MAALKAVLENLDGVQDTLHDLYEEKDGKFILRIEGINDHPETAGLVANSKRILGEKKKADADLAELKKKYEAVPEDFDAEEFERLREEDAERKANPDPKEEDLDKKYEAKWAAKFEQEKTRNLKEIKKRDEINATAKAENEALNREITTSTVEQEILKGLDEAGIVDPVFREASKAMLVSQVEVKAEDGKRIVRMKPDFGGDEAVKYIPGVWAQTTGKRFVEPAKGGDAKGANGSGNSGNNPWSPKTFDFDQQTKIFKADPAKARRLAKEHGVTL